MLFEDRVSAYPGRYRMTNANGGESYVTLERADDPLKEGTPLNAETFNAMQNEHQIESEDYPGCYYRMPYGDIDWMNPPMIHGVEYCTSERYLTLPVYVKRLVFDTMPTEALNSVSVDTGIPQTARVIGVSGMFYGKNGVSYPMPYVNNLGVIAWLGVSLLKASVFPDEYSTYFAELTTSTVLESGSAECLIKYVKYE